MGWPFGSSRVAPFASRVTLALSPRGSTFANRYAVRRASLTKHRVSETHSVVSDACATTVPTLHCASSTDVTRCQRALGTTLAARSVPEGLCAILAAIASCLSSSSIALCPCRALRAIATSFGTLGVSLSRGALLRRDRPQRRRVTFDSGSPRLSLSRRHNVRKTSYIVVVNVCVA